MKTAFCLSDLRLIEDKSPAIGHDRPEYQTIDRLLRTYPDLPFLLIGDSVQSDPELYREIAREHPGRMQSVYLHDVAEPEREEEVRRIVEQLKAEGVPTVHAEDTLPVAEHAAANGYISQKGLDEVRVEVERRRRES